MSIISFLLLLLSIVVGGLASECEECEGRSECEAPIVEAQECEGRSECEPIVEALKTATLTPSIGPTDPPLFVNGQWKTEFVAVDYSSPMAPPLVVNQDVIDILDGEHFDMLLKNDLDKNRRPSTVLFWDSTDPQCTADYLDFKYKRTTKIPSANRLMMGTYDMGAAPVRAWFKYTPERNLSGRFDVYECPTLVFVPKTCNGKTEWCVDPTPLAEGVYKVGCANYTEQCTNVEHWNSHENPSWRSWVRSMINEHGEVDELKNLQYYRSSQHRTETTVTRNALMPPSAPKFSEIGFQIMKIPDEAYKLLLDFQQKWRHKRFDEGKVYGIINSSAHTYMVSLDNNMTFRHWIAETYFQPILEKWSGLDLVFKSFYGVREYGTGATLRNHVDRIDTHVISVTMNLGPVGATSSWPLEAVNWKGENIRYDHPPGSMVLYESTSCIHGRPYQLLNGSHFGAFLHFSPANWRQIVPPKMRKRAEQRTTHQPYATIHSLKDVLSLFPFASYMDDRSVPPLALTVHNFYGVALKVFWDDGSKDGLYNALVYPAEKWSSTTYENHEWIFRSLDGTEVTRLSVSPDELTVVLTPEDSVEVLQDYRYQDVLKDLAFRESYKARTGRTYSASPYNRPATSLHMWEANFVGKSHTVLSSQNHCVTTACDTCRSGGCSKVPFTLMAVSVEPRVFVIENVVNEFERNHILKLAKGRMGASKVGQGRNAGLSNTRTSRTAWLPHRTDIVVETVCKRIMDIMGLQHSHLRSSTEDLQVVEYTLGQTYNSHYDWSFHTTNERYATFGVYLETPEKGGHTGFPRAFEGRGLKVKPPPGSAVLFYNFLIDGNGDELSVHTAMPVIKGKKVFSNLWIHDPIR